MKLGILLCDEVIEPLPKTHGQYPEMITNLFHPIDSSIEFCVFRVIQGEFPKDIDEVDAYITSGSRHGVSDQLPWIQLFEEFIRHLNAAQKKMVGICFGHQMIAKALGGKVIKSSKGWGIGMSQNTIYQRKEWMSPFIKNFNILVSHQDQIVELPKNAEILAGSEFCPNYLMQVGNHFLSLQGHPEFTKSYSNDLLRLRRNLFSNFEFDYAMKSLALKENDEVIARWILRFLSL